MTDDDDDGRSFSSKKFDLVNALVADTRLGMSSRAVAVYLTRHADRQWRLHPSQELIGLAVGLKPRAVKYCIRELIDTGWLHSERKKRQHANDYTFCLDGIDQVRERLDVVRDDLAAVRGKKLPLPNSTEVQEIAPPEVQDFAPQRGTELPPNTFSEHTEVEHLKGFRKEEGEYLDRGEPERASAALKASAPRAGRAASGEGGAAPATSKEAAAVVVDFPGDLPMPAPSPHRHVTIKVAPNFDELERQMAMKRR